MPPSLADSSEDQISSDYGRWAVLCILANCLKETACLCIGRWAPGFMQKHSLCDMSCKKDTALCVRYRQGSCHLGQQGHGTPRSPIKEGLLPSCQECGQQVATAASSFRVCLAQSMPSWGHPQPETVRQGHKGLTVFAQKGMTLTGSTYSGAPNWVGTVSLKPPGSPASPQPSTGVDLEPQTLFWHLILENPTCNSFWV